jgi:hypothetical protein
MGDWSFNGDPTPTKELCINDILKKEMETGSEAETKYLLWS